MSLLNVGTRCHTCALVDFLPLTCPSCAHVFCRDHAQRHECVPNTQLEEAAGPSRKRLRGTCAYGECQEETLESVGGFEGQAEDNVAREVRCVCGSAFCINEEAHDCSAPRALSARQDAQTARRERAQGLMAKHFGPARERMVVPKQVDRTRTGSPPRHSTATSSSTPSAPLASANTAPASVPVPAPPRTADEKLYKLHQTKTRSLACPLDDKIPRDESAAVEFVTDEDGARVRTWLAGGGKYTPTAAGAAMGGGKPERLWVPHVMPGGKLFDTLVARAKLPRSGAPLTVIVIALLPGAARAATPLDLTRPAGDQVTSGDVLVLVRGWE